VLATITIRREALPVVRSSIALEREALEFNTHAYQARLTEFERRHRISSEHFAAALSAGKLDDDAEWFEWKFVRDAYRDAKGRVSAMWLDSLRSQRCPLFL
jgi:hypothetical protein